MISLNIPVKLVSEANMREHWAVKNKRKKLQQMVVAYALAGLKRDIPAFPVHVTITRVGVRKLDSDNLAGSAKGVRDMIANILGCDDGDESRVTWEYRQRRGVPKEYSMDLTIAARSA